jgi:hypothetical protein
MITLCPRGTRGYVLWLAELGILDAQWLVSVW